MSIRVARSFMCFVTHCAVLSAGAWILASQTPLRGAPLLDLSLAVWCFRFAVP